MVLPDPTKPFSEQDPLVLLACLVFGESRAEPFQCKLAVAHIAGNRLPWAPFGTSLVQVALQFPCFNPNNPNCGKLLEPLRFDKAAVWSDCYFAAQLALDGLTPDPTHGAVFYHDATMAVPARDWGEVAKTATIGRLTFYRSVDGEAA